MQWQGIILLATEAMNNEQKLQKEINELRTVNNLNKANLKAASDEILHLKKEKDAFAEKIIELEGQKNPDAVDLFFKNVENLKSESNSEDVEDLINKILRLKEPVKHQQV